MEMLGMAGPSDGFLEAMLETLIALAIVAAICVSVMSLSAHLNNARTARAALSAHYPSVNDRFCETGRPCS